MLTPRINAPDFPGSSSSGKLLAGREPVTGVKTGSPVQTRSSSQLLTTPSSLLTRLGLPQDKLSASIVAFARYFSLPLESALLTKVRRQSLGANTGNAVPAKPSAGEQAGASAALSFKTREALSLAAIVAADKGVELRPDSLVDYSLAIDPDKRRSGDGGEGKGFEPGADHGGNDTGGGNKGGEAGSGAGGNPARDQDRGKFAGDAESLRDKILQAGDQNPLISLMNRLPGKKGQRWMVFPFSFEDQGRTFEVTLRILLTSAFRAERMALEIAGEDQHWLFIANNPVGGKLQVTGSFEKTTAKGIQSMERELAGLLGLAPEQVQIRIDEEFPPFAPDCRDEALLPVNEEV
ncbi:hypothetical protein AGMMS50255_3460 [Spirochaetia bacterium]|nr:hypothetical protein AGMMS50255_3460 [Spirochaetia bacterium]